MEELAVRWMEQNKPFIDSFIEGLGEYKARHGLSKVTGTPVINILMLPASRNERRFIVANVLSRDEENLTGFVIITPSEGQELTFLVTKMLNEAYPIGEFTVRRNKEFAIYIKFTEVVQEVI